MLLWLNASMREPWGGASVPPFSFDLLNYLCFLIRMNRAPETLPQSYHGIFSGGSTRIARKSFTLVRVGPVVMRSPIASKNDALS